MDQAELDEQARFDARVAREERERVRRERMEAVVASARAFLSAYDRAGGLGETQAEAATLGDALDALDECEST